MQLMNKKRRKIYCSADVQWQLQKPKIAQSSFSKYLVVFGMVIRIISITHPVKKSEVQRESTPRTRSASPN
jgi:hypothetical protein